MWLVLLLATTSSVVIVVVNAFAPHPIPFLPSTRSSSSIITSLQSSLQSSSSSLHNTNHHNHVRNIIILSHNVTQDVADGYFDVNTLLTGRIDVLSRCVNSALWISNGIRKDTNVYVMLFPQNVTIEVRGADVKGLNPDERTMALCLQRTLLCGDAYSLNADAENTTTTNNNNTTTTMQERRQSKIESLRRKTLKRPEVYNPNKPGAYTKSQKNKMRTARKQREAMIRRIQRSTMTTTTTTTFGVGVDEDGESLGDGDGGDGDEQEGSSGLGRMPTTDVPDGFVLHRDDSLEERLRILKGDVTFVMDEFGEPLLQFLSDKHDDDDDNADSMRTTNIILGDQMGYAPCDEQFLMECNDNDDDGDDDDDDRVVVTKVSLGPISLLTSHCITIAHNCLDNI